MKLEPQTKALAELDGWTDIYYFVSGNEWRGTNKNAPEGTWALPDYLTSYDAIISLIQKQPSEIQWATFTHLASIVSFKTPAYLGSAANYCEALIRATDKWKPVKSALPTVKSTTQSTVAAAAVCAAI